MNINEFKEKYAQYRDADQIEITCDHPDHIGNESIIIGKQPAKRNILKNGGNGFICRQCYMQFNNPMFNINKGVEKRHTSEEIDVLCPHPEHKGDLTRKMKKTSFYGELKAPYLQVCRSCSQLGREISDETKDAIRISLTGVVRSEEFKNKIRTFWETHPEHKQQAIANLLANKSTDGMLGKKHSDETKDKMSKAKLGVLFTEEHKNNISVGRKKMLQETGGFSLEHREKLRQATLEQYKNGFDPQTHHITGWHDSPKAGKVFFRSSYEKKAFLKLDADEFIKNYKTEAVSVSYYNPAKEQTSSYLIDLEIEKLDGSLFYVEVKPQKWLENETVKSKIKSGLEHAQKLNIPFQIWTEIDLFGPIYNSKHIKEFASKLRGDTLDDIETQKQKLNEKSKRHYEKHIKNDKITIFCEFCKEDHIIMNLSYNQNMKKNGRFICIKENGSIIGKKPKLYLQKENPYAKLGQKQCTKCSKILTFECFGSDKSRRDGYASQCKECRNVKG